MELAQFWLSQMYTHLGYSEIFLLMTLESSLFPVPAELVMIPAGYLSHSGHLNLWFALLAGASGSLLGACLNYVVASTLGRTLLLRYGRYLLIDAYRYSQAENLFLRNANLATFVGRLLPVIRHLISLPAGVFRMNRTAFALWTYAGASVLCGAELATGYYLGPPAVALARNYSHFVALATIALLIVGAAWLLIRQRQ